MYWLGGGVPFSADDVLTPEVRSALVDPSRRWVASSEPVTAVPSAIARAVAISPDGTAIVDKLRDVPGGFQLDRRARDQLAVAESVPLAPPAREGFGVAYTRLGDAVLIAGGHYPGGAAAQDLWIDHQGAWSTLPLDAARPPVDVETTTYAWGKARLWLVDRSGSGERHLYRINPWTGHVETLRNLHFLKLFDRVWLRTLDDGRVLLAATKEHMHFAAILAARPEAPEQVRLDGIRFGTGKLLKAPEMQMGA